MDGDVLGGQPRAEVVDEHGQPGAVRGRRPPDRCGCRHLACAVRVVVAEDGGRLAEVAGPAAPAGHDQGEPGPYDTPAGQAAERAQAGLGALLAEPVPPAGQDVAEVAVGLPGEQRGRPVAGQPGGQVLPGKRRAQARDEPAEVMPLDVTEQRRGAGKEDPRTVDLGEAGIEGGLKAAGGGPVGVGGLGAQGEQDVEVRHAGHGGAAGDAAVEVGAVQPGGAERGRDPLSRGRDDGREGARQAGEVALARDEAVVVEPFSLHHRTVPRAARRLPPVYQRAARRDGRIPGRSSARW